MNSYQEDRTSRRRGVAVVQSLEDFEKAQIL